MDKQTKQFLDSLSDEELMCVLCIRFGYEEPVWEECTQEEFESNFGKPGEPITWKTIEKWLSCSTNYKSEPCYKNEQAGIFWQIQNFGKEPDYYRYYKQVGTRFILMLGSKMLNYLYKRNPVLLKGL